MLPPWPPSPPEGPPRGTYFSRRKATQPLPPPPAFTKILASSTNTGTKLPKSRLARRRYRPVAAWKRKTRSNGRTAEAKTGGLNSPHADHEVVARGYGR